MTDARPTQAAQPTIDIGGTALAADKSALVRRVHVESTKHVPDLVEVWFDDCTGGILGSIGAEVGKEMTVTLGGAGMADLKVLVTITAVEAIYLGRDDQRAGIRGLDIRAALQRGTLSMTKPDTTFADFVKAIASKAKVDVTTKGTDGGVTRDHTIHAESPMAYLQREAHERGFEVRCSKDGKKVELVKPDKSAEAVVITRDANLRYLNLTLSGQSVPDEVVGVAWDAKEGKALKGSKTTKGESATVESKVHTAVKEKLTKGLTKHYILTTGTDVAEVEAKAAGGGERGGGKGVELRGECQGNTELVAGGRVELRGLGAPFDDKYVLSAVAHTWTPGGFQTRFEGHGSADGTLGGLASSGGSRNGLVGLHYAVVTNAEDPLGLNRVKVKFPYLTDGSTELESTWAPLVLPGAGKDRGLLFLPAVNDVVAVLFEHGDADRPVVIGGVYNNKDKPIGKAKESWAKGAIHEHMIGLGDTDTMVRAWSKSKERKLEVKLGPDYSIVIDEGGESMTFKSKGKFVVEAKGDITLTSKDGKVTVDAKQDLKLGSGSGKAALEGKSGVDVKSSGTATLKGGDTKIG